MKRLIAIALASLTMASAAGMAKDKLPVAIARGTQIGVVNLLDPEVMHYHAAKESRDSFLKIQAVNWSPDDMLNEALKGEAASAELTLMPLAPTDSLVRARESCFVNAPLVKGLPKNCSAGLVELASSAGVNYLILMAPGLNNADHAGNTRLEGVSEMLRGWGFFTRERGGSKDRPTLFSEIEMLLISVTAEGASLRARQWGGNYSSQWQSYTVPSDPKEIPPEQLDQLQPLFAGMLARQAKDLLSQVRVQQ
jgi:hypothetical protein